LASGVCYLSQFTGRFLPLVTLIAKYKLSETETTYNDIRHNQLRRY